jgi:signal transduction histidine kinase
MMCISLLIYELLRIALGERAPVLFIVLAVILVLSLGCTFLDFLRRRFTIEKPIEDILYATERIAAGDFTTRLEVNRSLREINEFDLIRENINLMTEQLAKSSVLKLDFTSNLSHEFKTPLTIISQYTKRLSDEKLSKEERDRCIDTVLLAASKLSQLVSNVLKLTRLDGETIKEEREVISLEESIATSVIAFEEALESKQIDLACDIEDIRLYTVGSYVEIIWNNLISNAIKFTNPGGVIRIKAWRDGKICKITVADNGIGMPREVGERIFDRFYQADTSHSTEGNGLGLALVKRVVEILGGSITVESEVSKGTSFTVALTDCIYDEKMIKA